MFYEDWDGGGFGDWFGDAATDIGSTWGPSGTADWGWLSDVKGFVSDNKSWLTPLAKGVYDGYKLGQANDAYLARNKPLQDYYNKMLPQLQEWYDPANVKAGVGAEFERRSGMLSDIWRGQDQPAYARALAGGTLNSSMHARQRAVIDASRNRQLMNEVLPNSETAYYNKPTQLLSQLKGTSGMFTQQPNMQNDYIEAQQDPWGTAFDRYIAKNT